MGKVRPSHMRSRSRDPLLRGIPMTDFLRDLEEYLPNLRRYARSLTRNLENADDLVQATLVLAISKQHLFKPDTNLRAWLFTLLHNQHVNDIRKSASQGVSTDINDAARELVAVADP